MLAFIAIHLGTTTCFADSSNRFEQAFVNFETAPVHPIALSPDRTTLAICNLADARLEVFDVTSGNLARIGMVQVGLDPVSVRFRNNQEAWIVNHISDSISVVDLSTLRVAATIDTLDTPADVVFAGSPARAYVSCALPNTIQVFDPVTRQSVTNITINAERPKALAVSLDGTKVYAAIFESGNATTIIGAKFRNLLFFSNVVSRADGPYGGQNPPPNLGTIFSPALNPNLNTNHPPPLTGLIVRKNNAGRWLDDNLHDWTEFVSGTNAHLTQRVIGWDLPDRDLAIVNTIDQSVTYASGLMNICMTLAVHPLSGRVSVVGSDAINEVRFEPNLNGIFTRVKIAMVDPLALSKTVSDLNPHLDYMMPAVPTIERDKSIGDPRAIAWSADGSRGFIAGMGSRNIIVVDEEGHRTPDAPIEVGEGPCGLALDEPRNRLYVFNRFSSSISVIDLSVRTVVNALQLFDPTPTPVAAGRTHLYDTRRNSGLGQASCASCHVDARIDRLGWDLGDPSGEEIEMPVNALGNITPGVYHPMKGVMVTQTLQDIIGHEPFHWRGDRADIESFNGTFTDLQGAPSELTTAKMLEFGSFLASIRFPPNPYRNFDNSLSTNVPLPGHVALGEGILPAGAPLPNGDAVNGERVFNLPGGFCVTCHTLPTGLGLDATLQGGVFLPASLGPNGGHHFPVAGRLEGPLLSKVAQFQNMADKIGMSAGQTESRAGFGFGHDGSIDSLTRFLNGVRVVPDRDVADLIALLLSTSGGDTSRADAAPARSPPASAGRQVTLSSATRPPVLDKMMAVVGTTNSKVALIAKGRSRGWWYDPERSLFQSDRQAETFSIDDLTALALPGAEITFTVVPRELGIRLGIDRDLDGVLDRDELDIGTDPADLQLLARVIVIPSDFAVGTNVQLHAQTRPMPAPGALIWRKDGQPLATETNLSLSITNITFSHSGEYNFVFTTPFASYTSAPTRITVAPLIVSVSPATAAIVGGNTVVFSANASGVGPFVYRWMVNGTNLPGALSSTLTITNVQIANEGAYQAMARNSYGGATSAPVRLVALFTPTALIPPLDQTVVAGADATFSVLVAGHPPPFGFQLRKGSSTLNSFVSDSRIAFLTLSNIQPSNAGTYRIVVTNAAAPGGRILDPVNLTVLADSDHDGLPDQWEAAHGLRTNDSADARLDADLDGYSNAQEYVASTDPRDAGSLPRIERITAVATNVVVQFQAQPNKTYTVAFRDSLAASSWTRLTDFVALRTNTLVSLTNRTDGPPTRYYRLITPRIP